jgi:hypothetical protein
MLLPWVLAILFNIHQIVHDIDTAGSQTETNRYNGRSQKEIWLEQLSVKDQRGIDDEVFCPLLDAHGSQQAAHIDPHSGRCHGN